MSELLILIPTTAACVIAVLYAVKRFFFESKVATMSTSSMETMERIETLALAVSEIQGKVDKIYLSRITGNSDKN